MRKAFVLAVCMAVMVSVGLLAQDAMDLDTALSFFVNDQVMVEFSEAGQAQLEQIIAAFKTALGVPEGLDDTDAGSGEEDVGALEIDLSLKHVVNKLSQAYYTLANVFLTTDDYFPTAEYLAGKHWGFKSLRMNPGFNDLSGGRFDDSVAQETDVRAMYWTNSNWLRASTQDKMGAIFGGVPAKAEMLMSRIVELDTVFIYGGVYRSLGGYYEQLPGLFGRDMNKALFNLCHLVDEPQYCTDCSEGEVGEMVANAYEYLENQTFFVEHYLIPEKHWEDAARILQNVLDSDIGEDAPLMNAYAKAHAQKLLEEVNEHL